jgi:hypothetical protein
MVVNETKPSWALNRRTMKIHISRLSHPHCRTPRCAYSSAIVLVRRAVDLLGKGHSSNYA